MNGVPSTGLGLYCYSLVSLRLAEELNAPINEGAVSYARDGDELEEVSGLHFTHGLGLTHDLLILITSRLVIS